MENGSYRNNPEGKINDPAIQALKQQLAGAGIDVSAWGKGEAKTLEHLLREVESGETTLVTDEHGGLLRKVVVGGADVYHVSFDGKKYRLKEEKQVFKDGRERRRSLGHAVSEKMKPDENPYEAMIRGIREELGIEGELTLIEIGVDEPIPQTPSYPGLQSQYIRHKFEVLLDESQFRPEGYIEEQQDKSTYFVWELVN